MLSTSFVLAVIGGTAHAADPVTTTGALPRIVATAPPGPKYVVAAKPTQVFVVAGLGARCASDVAPVVAITVQPAKGRVTVEPGIATTIQFSISGQCIGRPARGLGIVYVSDPDATGDDRFSISARMPSGAIATRDFTIRIQD